MCVFMGGQGGGVGGRGGGPSGGGDLLTALDP